MSYEYERSGQALLAGGVGIGVGLGAGLVAAKGITIAGKAIADYRTRKRNNGFNWRRRRKGY